MKTSWHESLDTAKLDSTHKILTSKFSPIDEAVRFITSAVRFPGPPVLRTTASKTLTLLHYDSHDRSTAGDSGQEVIYEIVTWNY